jgi:hypothetical protein
MCACCVLIPNTGLEQRKMKVFLYQRAADTIALLQVVDVFVCARTRARSSQVAPAEGKGRTIPI